MNTHKQIVVMVILMFALAGSCAAYTAVDLPIRAENQQEYHLNESIERGALLFANNCRGCHGDRGQGGIGLPLNTPENKDQTPLVLEANKQKLTRTLYCGRLGTFMQPWLNTNGGSLNTVQVQHLVELITDPEGKGWDHAVEFSHNLNHESPASVGGDTVGTIAKTFRVGVAELVALNPEYAADAPLPKGAEIKLPKNSQFPDGRVYKVLKTNESLTKIADGQRVGQAILVDMNATTIEPGKVYSFEQNVKRNTFTLLVDGQEATGLFPGSKLKLPAEIGYAVTDRDTLTVLSGILGVSADQLKSLNPPIKDVAADEILEKFAGTVLKLPAVDAYVVKGQSIADVAGTYVGLPNAAEEFAKENGIDVNTVLRIGQSLIVPPGAWGVTPGGTPNNGKACIEHAVPKSVFEQLTGGGSSTGPERPSAKSKTVEITAHANDWTVTADGTAQDPNKGVVWVDVGTKAQFKNAEGIHTITVAGQKKVDIFAAGQEQEITFDKAGTFAITCDFHPDMKATVFVGEGDVAGSSGGASTRPAQLSTNVEVVAHANDWTVTADGTAQAPNKGVVAVAVGTTVKFQNAEGIHTVTIDGVKQVPVFQVGQTSEFAFTKAGTSTITCDFHPDMRATVFVGEG